MSLVPAACALLLALADPAAPAQAPPGAPATSTAPTNPTAPAAPTPQEVAPLRLSSRVDKARASLGEPFTLRIEVVLPPELAVALPDPLRLEPLALRGPPQVARDRVPEGARTTFTLPLANVASLDPRVPDLTLPVQGPEGARVLRVPGQKLELDSLVAASGAPDPAHAHRGPKPPVPVWVRSFLWAGALAALAAACAAAILLYRVRQRRLRPAPEAPPPPHQVALDRLTLLRRREPWRRGEGRAAIFELSETLRAYLGQRLGFDALDLTREELLLGLDAHPLPGLDLAALAKQLAWEDLVKFARVEPQAAECVDAIDLAESIVRRTRPFPSPPPGATDPAKAPAPRATSPGAGEARG